MGFKTQNWSHFGKTKTVERERGEEKREEEEEEEKKKRRDEEGGVQEDFKVWNFGFCMDHMDCKALYD